MLVQPNAEDLHRREELPIPTEAKTSIQQCHKLLDDYTVRVGERLNFLESAASHIRDVIVPAMEDFAHQFPKLEFTLDSTTHPHNPSAVLRYESPRIPGTPSLSIGVRYEPSTERNLMQFSAIHGGQTIHINTPSLDQLTRDAVIRSMAGIFLTGLRKDLKPED